MKASLKLLSGSVLALSLLSCGESVESLASEDAGVLTYLMIKKSAPELQTTLARLRAALKTQSLTMSFVDDGDCSEDVLELPSDCEIDTCEALDNVLTATINCDLDSNQYSCSDTIYKMKQGGLISSVVWDLNDQTIEIDADVDVHLTGTVEGNLTCLFNSSGEDTKLGEAEINCDDFQCSLEDEKLSCTDFKAAWKAASSDCDE